MNLGDLVVRIIGGNEEFDAAVDKSKYKYEAFISTLEKGGKTLTKFVTLPILALGTAAVKAAADMEMQEAAFTTLLGSATKAKNLLSELKTFAAKTPFALGDLTKSTQMLVGFGLETDKAVGIMKQIGDIAQGNKDKFLTLSLAFGQASSTGRLMGQDLMQMINSGFNPLLQISNDTGISMVNLKKKMEAGEITVGMLEDAFKNATSEGGRFYKGMETASKTLTGQFSTLMDTTVDAARSFGEVLLPVVKDMIGRATALAEKFTNLDTGTKKLIIGVGIAAASIGPLMLIAAKTITVFNTLKTAVVAVSIALKAMDATTKTTIAGLAIAGIALLIGGLITLRSKTIDAKNAQDGLNKSIEESGAVIKQQLIKQLELEASTLRYSISEIGRLRTLILTAPKGSLLGEQTIPDVTELQQKLADIYKKLQDLRAPARDDSGGGGKPGGVDPEEEKKALVAANELAMQRVANLSKADELRAARQIQNEADVQVAIKKIQDQEYADFVALTDSKLDETQRFALADEMRLNRQLESTAAVEAEITRMTQEEEAKRVAAAEAAEARKTQIREAWVNLTSSAIGYIGQIQNNMYEEELQNAEGNEKEIRRIKREQAKSAKAFAVFDIILKTAQAIMGFLANPSGTAGVALSIGAGILGALQLAAVASQPLPKLARGGVVMPSPGGSIVNVAEANVPEVIFPLDRLGDIISSMPAMQTAGGDAGMIHLQVNMDSAPILEQIFPATRNGRILIDARAVVG